MSSRHWFGPEAFDITPDRPCVRCGYCCTQVTCIIGMHYGADAVGCMFLGGDEPGEHWCCLAARDSKVAHDIGIGLGCCMPLNSTRKEVIG